MRTTHSASSTCQLPGRHNELAASTVSSRVAESKTIATPAHRCDQAAFVPYTLIVDVRVAAVVQSEADTSRASRMWSTLDRVTIKAVEIVPETSRGSRDSLAVRKFIKITRCYWLTAERRRPSVSLQLTIARANEVIAIGR